MSGSKPRHPLDETLQIVHFHLKHEEQGENASEVLMETRSEGTGIDSDILVRRGHAGCCSGIRNFETKNPQNGFLGGFDLSFALIMFGF